MAPASACAPPTWPGLPETADGLLRPLHPASDPDADAHALADRLRRAGLPAPRRRSVPRHGLPGRDGRGPDGGREPRGDRAGRHRRARGAPQHDRRRAPAPQQVLPRHQHHHGRVRARPRHRHRGAGRARQGGARPLPAPAGRRAARRRQGRLWRRAGSLGPGQLGSAAGRGERVRPELHEAARGDDRGRGVGGALRRARARDPDLAGRRGAARPRAGGDRHPGRRAARARRAAGRRGRERPGRVLGQDRRRVPDGRGAGAADHRLRRRRARPPAGRRAGRGRRRRPDAPSRTSTAFRPWGSGSASSRAPTPWRSWTRPTGGWTRCARCSRPATRSRATTRRRTSPRRSASRSTRRSSRWSSAPCSPCSPSSSSCAAPGRR